MDVRIHSKARLFLTGIIAKERLERLLMAEEDLGEDPGPEHGVPRAARCLHRVRQKLRSAGTLQERRKWRRALQQLTIATPSLSLEVATLLPGSTPLGCHKTPTGDTFLMHCLHLRWLLMKQSFTSELHSLRQEARAYKSPQLCAFVGQPSAGYLSLNFSLTLLFGNMCPLPMDKSCLSSACRWRPWATRYVQSPIKRYLKSH